MGLNNKTMQRIIHTKYIISIKPSDQKPDPKVLNKKKSNKVEVTIHPKYTHIGYPHDIIFVGENSDLWTLLSRKIAKE